jgi:hypothetical protein
MKNCFFENMNNYFDEESSEKEELSKLHHNYLSESKYKIGF